MSKLIVSVTTAVGAAITAAPDGTFSLPFTPSRCYRGLPEREDLDGLQVWVMPGTDDREPDSRDSARRDLVVHVAIGKALESTTDPADTTRLEEVDGLIGLAEEIKDFFTPADEEETNGLTHGTLTGTAARWASTSNKPIYDPEAMEKRVFFTVIAVTFRAQ